MEEMYQYLWFHRMTGRRLQLSGGETVEVVSPGVWNHDAGPDFFNAKILINGIEWAGNVEIHVKASDWFRHGHDKDSSYDSVILHIVGINDAVATCTDGSSIQQAVMTLPPDFFQIWANLESRDEGIKCSSLLHTLPRLCISDWIETLAIERIQNKARRIIDIYNEFSGDWMQTAFAVTARSLGFGLNGEPMEMLARSLPLRFVFRHTDNRMQIEALLFGQAGLLDSRLHTDDMFYQRLCGEYGFLRKKYSLSPLDGRIWKLARTRPQNFPHRRIARLANYLCGGFQIASSIFSADSDVDRLAEFFQNELDGYWSCHYLFGEDVSRQSGSGTPVAMSKSSLHLMVLNAALPLLYAKAALTGDYERGERVFELLRTLPAERNSIVNRWRTYGLEAADALESQALIQLSREYCNNRKCFYCRFGHRLLRNSLV